MRLVWVLVGLWKVASVVIGISFLLPKTDVISASLIRAGVVPVVFIVAREVQHIRLVALPRARTVQATFRVPSRWVVEWTVVLLARAAILILVYRFAITLAFPILGLGLPLGIEEVVGLSLVASRVLEDVSLSIVSDVERL